MKLHDLSPAFGSKKTKTRVGRGMGSGLGKTSGRGHKGQKSRSGGGVRPGFEGGQKPLYLRLPKRGFNNSVFAKEYVQINISELNRFENGEVVDIAVLVQAGLVKKVLDGLKILGDGELTKSVTVKANKFTKSAAEKIQSAGGSVEVI